MSRATQAMTTGSGSSRSERKNSSEVNALDENRIHDPSRLPLEDVDDLLTNLDDINDIHEPDPSVLSQEAEDLEKLVKDEPLSILDNPGLLVELSEDPVRLYLKEIGEIDLLDTDREFWLSTQLEAERRIEQLSRGHPIVRRKSEGEEQRSNAPRIYQALFVELRTAWRRMRGIFAG